MTHATVSPRQRRVRPQPSARARVGRRDQAAVRRHAAEQERRRLARDLHDGAIQEILAAGLTLDLCLSQLPGDSPLHARLEDARRLTSAGLRQLRSVLQSLREAAGAPREELPVMLRRLQAGHPGRDLDVSLEITGPPVPLPADLTSSLFQIARECVFNAAVHAHARRAVIRVSYGPGVITLCVADDGRGKPKTLRKLIRGEVPGTGAGYHSGLADVAGRAQEMGGTISADRSDLGGIAITVLLRATPPSDMRGETHG